MLYHHTIPVSDGKLQPQCLDAIEKVLGNNVTLYAHGITRGGKTKVTITPAATPVAWIPNFGDAKKEDAFGWKNLGQWLPSLETEASSGGGKFLGYHRPVFEVQGTQKPPPAGQAAGSTSSWSLQPNPAPGANALHIFTSKKLEMAAHEYMAMH